MGIAELKALLSETLARVKAGEEVLVTEHSRPIARLMPLSAATPAAATQELVRAGLVQAPEKAARRGVLEAAAGTLHRPAAGGTSTRYEEWELREAV